MFQLLNCGAIAYLREGSGKEVMRPFYPTLIILRANQPGVNHGKAAAGAWCVNIVNKGLVPTENTGASTNSTVF